MTKTSRKRAALYVAAGLIIGLSAGVGMMVATLVATSRQPTVVFPERPVFAGNSHGASTFSMATGRVGQDTEGVFMLDFITGDLTCLVVYPRSGQFKARFTANVVRDLGATAARKKDPAYVMVTGNSAFRNQNVGRCVVYVADANTGNYVAYGLPWNRNAINTNTSQEFAMTVLTKGTARNIRRN